MLKPITFALVTAFMLGCATNSNEPTRTQYGPNAGNGGYEDEQSKDSVSVSKFSGNSMTHPQYVKGYSLLRAIEVCKAKGFRVANVINIKDMTSKKDVQISSTITQNSPTYVTGDYSSNTNSTANAFGGNGNVYGNGTSNTNSSLNGTVYGGGQVSNTYNSTQTIVMPVVATYYKCANNLFKLDVGVEELPSDQVKTFTKDFMGAIHIKDVQSSSPNSNILSRGDVVIKVAGKRVESVAQMQEAVASAKNKDKVPLLIIRDGAKKELNAKAIDKIEDSERAQNKFIQGVCKEPDVVNRPLCKE